MTRARSHPGVADRSPRVGQTSGWMTSNGRLPVLRRTLTTSSGFAPARTSSRPFLTVLIARPVARATADPAVADRVGFGACPQAPRALIHGRLQQPPLLAQHAQHVHARRRSRGGRNVDRPRSISSATRSTSRFPAPDLRLSMARPVPNVPNPTACVLVLVCVKWRAAFFNSLQIAALLGWGADVSAPFFPLHFAAVPRERAAPSVRSAFISSRRLPFASGSFARRNNVSASFRQRCRCIGCSHGRRGALRA